MTPDKLKAARASLGLSAHDMALALGLGDRARVYEYEQGRRSPSGPALVLYRVYLLKPQIARDVIDGRI